MHFRYLINKILAICCICICFSSLAQSQHPLSDSISYYNPRQLDSLERAMQAWELQRVADPAIKRVPTERLDAAQKQLAQSKTAQNGSLPMAGVPGVNWTERGPTSFAMDMRALLVDLSDPSRKKVWAGSVTGGGLWVTSDITDANATWSTVSDTWENRTISTLATDPANPQVIYAGTGEMISPYYAYNGGGIWKTTNGGVSWSRLSSTIPASSGTSLQMAFRGISKVVVGANSVVFAATTGGVVRSTDGGNSWSFVLAPQQSIGGTSVSSGDDGISDLEAGSDGIVFAATRTGRLFRATTTAGTSWIEITPPGTAPYNGTRTELALAPSTSGSGQVVYAIGLYYNSADYSKDLKWFLKSTDGGTSWTAVTRPIYSPSNTYDFTVSDGVRSLLLAVHPTDPSRLYAPAGVSVYSSTDGGQSWISTYFNSTQKALIIGQQNTIRASSTGINFSTVFPAYWSSTAERRNKGFNTSTVNSTAMKSLPANPYVLLGGENDLGLAEQMDAGASEGQTVNYVYPKRLFVDQDQPGIAVGASAYGYIVTKNTANSIYWSGNSMPGNSFMYNTGLDYDSRNNTLFIWNYGYYKITGIGGQISINAWNLGLGQPGFIKVGLAANTLFIHTNQYNLSGSQLYKVTNADQASPTLVRIDGGVFPTGSTISSIDIGATDNQLLVTLSNYGVRSVWYTNDGGANWYSKDESAYGLPDIPVYWALFNPADRRQVMLATELGIWSTADITAVSPAWEISNSGLPLIRVNHLSCRPSDGRVLASTQGRGVWETNVWAVPFTAPQLTVAPLSTTALCVNSTMPVNFTLTNGSNTQYRVRLSASDGSFIDSQITGTYTSIIGTGTSSPITVRIPSYLAYSTTYRIQVEAVDLGITTTASETLAISDLTRYSASIRDRRNFYDSYTMNISYGTYTLCPGSVTSLIAYTTNGSFRPSTTFRWAVNGAIVSGQQSTTLQTGMAGAYSFSAIEAGCSLSTNSSYNLVSSANLNRFTVFDFSNKDPKCLGTTSVIGVSTLGETATYQWYKDGVAIAGATSLTYAATESGVYAYSVQEGTCSLTRSSEAQLFFSTAIYSPTLYVSGQQPPVLCGTSSLRIYSEGTSNGTRFQWYKDNSPIPNATDYYLDLDQPGLYTLQSKRGQCSAFSNPILVSRGTQLTNEIQYSGSLSVCAGATKSLTSKTYGSSLQWMKDGVDIPSAINSSYYASTTGVYTVRTINGVCSVTATPVSLTFTNEIVPELQVREYCTNANFYVLTDQGLSGVYTWYRDGVAVQTTTSTDYYPTQSGVYNCSVTYGNCKGTSKSYQYIAGAPAKPVIASDRSLIQCANTATLLKVVSGVYSYWKRDGVRVSFSSSGDFYYFYPTQSGRYTLVYDESGCYTESDPLDVVIGAPTAATLTGNALVQAGQPAALAVGFSGPAPWSFTLSNGLAVENTYQNPYNLVLSPTATTSYSLAAIRNYCGAGTGNGLARITVGAGSADLTLSTVVSNRTPRVGDMVSYSFTVTNAGPQDASGVKLTDQLPPGLVFVDGSPGWNAPLGPQVSIALGNIPVGYAVTASFRVMVTSAGMFINASEISDSQTPDPDSQPGSGTGDGQDDASQVDMRTLEAQSTLFMSPNPNQQQLPAVMMNQPVAIADQADLSLQLQVSTVTPLSNDPVTVTAVVTNGGGKAAGSVRIDVLIPNGFYRSASNVWIGVVAPTVVPVYINSVSAGKKATATLQWRPTTSAQLVGEIGNSNVPDPDSTPGNRLTRSGEDDEASLPIRVK